MLRAKEIVKRYWKDMESNDFSKAAENLDNDFICRWPQSNEMIIGKENFIKINSNYPAVGRWKFKINNILEEDNKVVTDVSITDGEIKARAITFHIVKNNFIIKQTEFWPEDYDAPEWRRKWVKNNEDDK